MQELSTIMLHPPSSLPGTFPTYPSFAQGEFTITSVARVRPHSPKDMCPCPHTGIGGSSATKNFSLQESVGISVRLVPSLGYWGISTTG